MSWEAWLWVAQEKLMCQWDRMWATILVSPDPPSCRSEKDESSAGFMWNMLVLGCLHDLPSYLTASPSSSPRVPLWLLILFSLCCSLLTLFCLLWRLIPITVPASCSSLYWGLCLCHTDSSPSSASGVRAFVVEFLAVFPALVDSSSLCILLYFSQWLSLPIVEIVLFHSYRDTACL